MPYGMATGASLWLKWQKICLQHRRPKFEKVPWRREWQSTPVFLPGEFHGQRSLASYSPWGRKELDVTEWLTLSPSCGMWNLISPIRNWTHTPCTGRQSLPHWTTREVPNYRYQQQYWMSLQKHYAKWKKPDTKDYILFEIWKLRTQKDHQFLGVEQGLTSNMHKRTFWVVEIF